MIELLPLGASVAVLRLRSMGDCILTTPALQILRKFRPDLIVGVVVEDRFRALFEEHPCVDQVLSPRTLTLRRFHPQLCLNLHGGSSSTRLTMLSGARYRAGFAHYRPSWPYNIRIPRAQEILGEERPVHTAEHLASAVFHLGAPRVEIPRASLPGKPLKGRRPYALVHPFASDPTKVWPAGYFLEICHWLRSSQGLEPLITGGPQDDFSAFAEFRTAAGLPLAEFLRVAGGATVFVGNDSGPAHAAAAFGVPCVVFFGGSNPDHWRPWRTVSEVICGDGDLGSVSPEETKQRLARVLVMA